MVQTTEILKILHGMQHDLQAIDQKHTLLLSHTKAQKEKADQDLTAEIAAQEQALKKAETCLIQTRIQIQQDSDKQREQFYEQARQEAVLMSSVIECLEERHIYLKTNDKYFRKYHTKMAPTLQQKIEAAYQDVDDILQEAKSVYDMHETYFSTTGKYRLPVIINGLNYMLSSKRKELYRTLIECYSRAICLKEQLEKNEFLERSFQKLNQDCQMQLQQAEQQYHAAEIRKEQAVNRLQKETVEKKEAIQQQFQDAELQLKKSTMSLVQNAMPWETFLEAAKLMVTYLRHYGKINSNHQDLSGLLFLGMAEYHYGDGITWDFLKKAVHDRFKKVAVKDFIRMPITIREMEQVHFFVDATSMGADRAEQFMHQILFSAFSFAPLGEITCNIMDKLKFGNHIKPFFNLKEQLPELFHHQIFTEYREIENRICEINNDMMNDLYANKAENPPLFLVLFDFPDTYNENTLLNLKNILENGHKCNIHVILHGSRPKEEGYKKESNKLANEILALCVPISQKEWNCDGFPMTVPPFPTAKQLKLFQETYVQDYRANQNSRNLQKFPRIQELRACSQPEAAEQLLQQMENQFDAPCSDWNTTITQFPNAIPFAIASVPSMALSGTAVSALIHSNRPEIKLPYEMNFRKQANFILHVDDQSEAFMQQLSAQIICNYLRAFPVSKGRVVAIDCKKAGGNTVAFQAFSLKFPEVLERVTDHQAVSKILKNLAAQIVSWGTKFKDGENHILDYNQKHPKISEICTLLMIYNFPAAFEGYSKENFSYLKQIIENGNKYGIYTVLSYDHRCVEKDADSENLAGIFELFHGNEIAYSDGTCYHKPSHCVLHPVAGNAITEKDCELFESYQKQSEQVGISPEDILDQKRFQRSNLTGISIPIGIGTGEKIVDLKLSARDTNVHALILGGTRGGKSVLLNTIIMNAMLCYAPEELQLYLLDFKDGVEFELYRHYRLPHIRVLGLASQPEFGKSILESLMKDMEQRSEIFGTYTNIDDYNHNSGKKLPHFLIIIDEFQSFYSNDIPTKCRNAIVSMTHELLAKGGAFGYHFIMASQKSATVRSLQMQAGDIDLMTVRFGLKCLENDYEFLFKELGNDAYQKRIGPPGTAIMNPNIAEGKSNEKLRVAFFGKRRNEFLQEIQDDLQQVPMYKNYTIFSMSDHSNTLDYLSPALRDSKWVEMQLALPVKVADPFVIEMNRKNNHNLLIGGTDEELPDNLVKNYLLSALWNRTATVYCIDGEILIEENRNRLFYQVLKRHFSKRFYLAESDAEIVSFLVQVYEIYQQRKRKNTTDPIFVVVKNVQNVQLVKKMFERDRILMNDYLDEEMPAEAETEVSEPIPSAEALKEEADQFAAVDLSFLLKKTAANLPEPESKNPFATLRWDSTPPEAPKPTPEPPVAPKPAPKPVPPAPKAAPVNYDVSKILEELLKEGTMRSVYFLFATSEVKRLKEMNGSLLKAFEEHLLSVVNAEELQFTFDGMEVSKNLPKGIAQYHHINENEQIRPHVPPEPQELEQFLSKNL